MKILAALWMVFLVGVCHYGRDDGKSKTDSNDPNAIDLSKPDRSKVSMAGYSSDGVTVKEYTPKSGFNVTSVLDAGKELWKPAESYQKFVSAKVSSKGNVSLLLISANTGVRHFEKNGSTLTQVTEKDYEQKLKEFKYAD